MKKILPIILILIIFIITFSTTYSYYSTECIIDEVQYFVEEGDSLWSIAKEYNFNNEDVRKVIYRIEKYNNISNAIDVGQEIIIPVLN